MSGGPDRFIDAAFRHGPGIEHSSALRRRDYLDRIVAGGFPEAVRRAPQRRAAFFDSYLSTLIERDVLELASIERRGDLFKLLSLLAGRAGSLLVPAALAGQSGIPRTTLVRYLQLLSAVFLIKQIPAWSAGQAQRAIGTPKLAFVDTGIASHLLGQDTTRLGEPDGAAGPPGRRRRGEGEIRDSDLDWTIFRPPALNGTGATGDRAPPPSHRQGQGRGRSGYRAA